ncbi:MAG: aminotransferase class V-fold PLP-dependent enzyme [Planctomycetota bacterium]|nr:aminotransferase class V-fold PLP-dependent enzyme [Planctomycetota bacterium]
MTIYLDHGATSWPKPERVIAEMSRFLKEDAANPGRSGHDMARRASQAVWDARLALARFLGGVPVERVIFCSGATDALNTAIHGFLDKGDHVLITPMEHNSVLRPLALEAETRGVTFEEMKADEFGLIDLAALRKCLEDQNPRLICVNHASNVNGILQPLDEICEIAKAQGAKVLVDAAQTLGSLKIDARKVDFLALPAHKGVLGPTGVGALYVAPDIKLRGPRQGGTGAFSEQESMPEIWPEAMEAGTLNAVGIVGLHEGLKHLIEIDFEQAHREKMIVLKELLDRLQGLPKLTLYAPQLHDKPSVGVFSMNVEAYESAELANILDGSFDIATRAGLHCAPRAHKHLRTGPYGALRVSLGLKTTKEELREFEAAIRVIHG